MQNLLEFLLRRDRVVAVERCYERYSNLASNLRKRLIRHARIAQFGKRLNLNVVAVSEDSLESLGDKLSSPERSMLPGNSFSTHETSEEERALATAKDDESRGLGSQIATGYCWVIVESSTIRACDEAEQIPIPNLRLCKDCKMVLRLRTPLLIYRAAIELTAEYRFDTFLRSRLLKLDV